jgi:hypothetical protein
MSKILKAMPFGPAGRKRQNGVKPVEGLDSAELTQVYLTAPNREEKLASFQKLTKLPGIKAEFC